MSQATSATTPTGAPVKAGRSFCPLTCDRDRLVAELMMLTPPRIPITPDGEDIRALGDHLTNVARAVDTYIGMIGRELASNSPTAVDPSQFDQLSPAAARLGLSQGRAGMGSVRRPVRQLEPAHHLVRARRLRVRPDPRR
jgi:hypothetical protein